MKRIRKNELLKVTLVKDLFGKIKNTADTAKVLREIDEELDTAW